MDNLTCLKKMRRILVLTKNSLAYSKDPFDRERLNEVANISAEILASIAKTPINTIDNTFLKDQGYLTPKVDVRVFFQNKYGEVLLVQDQFTKEWSLPGGFAEIGMSPVENARREVYEEIGRKATIDGLRAIFDTNKSTKHLQVAQYYKLIFSGTLLDDTAFKANVEISNMSYFALVQLPQLSIKRTNPEQLTIVNQAIKDGIVYVE